MDVKVTVKRRIRYQGKEYESVNELPEPIRRAYEGAMAGGGGAGPPTAVQRSPARIIFNGCEYDGVGTMPQDVRDAYESVMRAVASGESSGAMAGPSTTRLQESAPQGQAVSAAPIEPGSAFPPRTVVVLILGLLLLMGLLSCLLFQRPGG